jgi:ribosomal protein S18 acetylase RimI-like enzyme
LIIRQAHAGDVAALCELMQHVQTLHAEAYHEIFRRVLDPDSTARFFADTLTQDRNIVLVASIDERTIGYVWCEERVSAGSFYAHESHSGHIHHVSVSPSHRRRGVGKTLVDQALAELKRGARIA